MIVKTDGKHRTKVGASSSRSTTHVPLEKCHPHPRNRPMTDADCADLAESLKADGQLQPILIRTVGGLWPSVPIGHYQIVFGERRWRAARLAGWDSIEAEIAEDISDAEALRLMAIENAKRKDLTPIDQAKAIKTLCDPVDIGGGGMTRDAAAAIFGLQTGAAASNKVRLLQLPEVWQQRVISGELPETAARELLPYVEAKSVMRAIGEEYDRCRKHDWERDDVVTREGLANLADNVAHTTTRSFTDKRWYSSISSYAPCLIKLDDELRQRLEVVTLTLDGKQVEVAQNAKLFDELQEAALQRKKDKAASKTLGKGSQEKAAAAKRSPAEQKRLEEQQAEQLRRRIHEWRQQWIRDHLAQVLGAGDWQVTKLLLWASSAPFQYRSSQPFDRAVRAFGGKGDGFDAWKPLCAIDPDRLNAFAVTLADTMLTGGGESPQPLPDELVDGLAADYGLKLAELWKEDQSDETGRKRLRRFFELHQTSQLHELAEELKVSVPESATKAGAINLVLLKMESKPLALPRSLGSVKKGRKR